MINLQIKISETDYKKYNLDSKQEIKFSDLVEKISLQYAKQALLEANAIAARVGLSTMSLEEIDAEINAVRNAESNS